MGTTNEELFTIGVEKNRTPELLYEVVNVDPVTGYPFETPRVRGKILDILQEASDKQGTVIFIDADIDDLKRLNDSLGHGVTNFGIKAVVEDKENVLSNLEGVNTILCYRPQAGGDEYKVLLLVGGSEEDEGSALESLQTILKPSTHFQPKEGQATAISCSYGIVMKQLKGGENPGELLQEMEEIADERVVTEKLGKLVQKMNKTVEKGSKMGIDEYIDLIVSEWGSRRLGERVLREILVSVSERSKFGNGSTKAEQS